MTLFVGDDWAEAHHDVHLMDQGGERLAGKRLPEGLDGIGALHALISEHATDPGDVVVGIETERGMWVQSGSAEISTALRQFSTRLPLRSGRSVAKRRRRCERSEQLG